LLKESLQNCQTEELSFSLAPGEEKEFFHTNTPGRIVGFEINSEQLLHKNVFLQAIWDEEEVPAIKHSDARFLWIFHRKAIHERNDYRK